MKKAAFLSALALLAACGPDEGAQSSGFSSNGSGVMTAGGKPGAVDPSRLTAADGGSIHGVFRITNADGDVSIDSVMEDGSFASTYSDGSRQTGTWLMRGPGLFCVTMDYEDAEEACFQEGMNSEGEWVSYDPESETSSRVERLEAEPIPSSEQVAP